MTGGGRFLFEDPDYDILLDLAANRISIYSQMSRYMGVIDWIEEINRSSNMGLSTEIRCIRSIIDEAAKAAKVLARDYPSQELIEGRLGYLLVERE